VADVLVEVGPWAEVHEAGYLVHRVVTLVGGEGAFHEEAYLRRSIQARLCNLVIPDEGPSLETSKFFLSFFRYF
jgi:hypothetical protein